MGEICLICNENANRLPYHIREHKINANEYYDRFLRKEDEGKCYICSSETVFGSLSDGYKKYCSKKCSNICSETNGRRVETHKRTLEDNPEIGVKQGKKFRETIKNNPDIIRDRIESFKNTLLNNPEIREKISEGISQWAKVNPSQAKEKALKGAKTIRNDSDKLEAKRKRISVALRDKYKELKQSNSTIPCYLYIVRNLANPIIKIGITENPNKRFGEIDRNFGKSEMVYIIKYTHEKALGTETYLHNYFEDYCKVQPEGSGRTEWFNDCILEETLKILKERHI